MKVAIIGAGFCGTTLAIRLAQISKTQSRKIEPILFEKDRLAAGPAFSTEFDSHLLNVRAGDMGAFAEDPRGFSAWLSETATPDDYVPRKRYGEYLRSLLPSEMIRTIGGEVLEARRQPDGWTIRTQGIAETSKADVLVLALGNSLPAVPSSLRNIASTSVYVANPWDQNRLRAISSADEIFILGTGLTALDVALALEDLGHMGRMTALSRHGLLPEVHEPTEQFDAIPIRSTSVSEIFYLLRKYSNEFGWRRVLNWFRPQIQGIWLGLPESERQRFLRHLRSQWEVRRHRMAPEISKRIEQLIGARRLEILAGNIVGSRITDGGASLSLRLRGSDSIKEKAFAAVINCTGPSNDLLSDANPLLAQLHRDGFIRPGPIALGIDATPAGAVIDEKGTTRTDLFALGSLLRGVLWETTAVPELRQQVKALSESLAEAA